MNGGERMEAPLRDTLVSCGLAFASIAALGMIARGVPLVAANLGALVAVVFILIPFVYGDRHNQDLVAFGFHAEHLSRSLAIALGALALVFPVFVAGFVLFYDMICSSSAPALLAELAPHGMCPDWRGWSGIRWPPTDGLAVMALTQLIVVAIPEELFFRGFILKLLETRWVPRRRLLGGGIGLALVVSSLLFAVGHMLVVFDPRRLAVFFPGLVFGWMRSATGSIVASVIFHMASNLLIDYISKMFS